MDVHKNRAVVDVSSFLLFEATGDSEAGGFDPPHQPHAMPEDDHDHDVDDNGHDYDDDDDDAESCSCDTYTYHDHSLLPSGVGVGNRRATHWLEGKANVDDDDDDDDDGGEVVEQKQEVVVVHGHGHGHHVHEKWKQDDQPPDHILKSTASVDSTKSMNEMEKSRLFWETCLAS